MANQTPPNVTAAVSTRKAVAKAGLISFVFVMYSYTTAGPFGLEDMVTTSGPGMTLIYLLAIPFFWCIPISLVAAELTTAMPVEGGFYRWSRVAFGDFWGFLAGWWNWCASFLLGASSAVLFTDYIKFFFPQVTGWKHYLVCVAIIAVIAYVNVRGIGMVGRVATVLEIAILLPVAAMCLMSARLWHHNPFTPLIPPHMPMFRVFGVGLALGIWLYSGYEQLSTVAEEVENPQRTFPRALAWVIPLSIATYFVPAACALAALGDWQQWTTGYFSQAARLIGGPVLGFAITVAAAVTSIALLNSTVLTTTRMPFAMAQDGYLSDALTRRHPLFGTPWIAIVFSAVIYCALAWVSFTQLIAVYAWLRIATSILTVLSAWQLRRKRPEMPRAFRIPGGKAGLAYAVAAPVAMSAVALLASDRFGLIWGPFLLVLGVAAYGVFRRRPTSS
ncbi:MAG TPA: APC family permease [Candidatus Angelobacter sp.]|nr:APC family permease [Candidatus Angelobacter sp.]